MSHVGAVKRLRRPEAADGPSRHHGEAARKFISSDLSALSAEAAAMKANSQAIEEKLAKFKANITSIKKNANMGKHRSQYLIEAERLDRQRQEFEKDLEHSLLELSERGVFGSSSASLVKQEDSSRSEITQLANFLGQSVSELKNRVFQMKQQQKHQSGSSSGNGSRRSSSSSRQRPGSSSVSASSSSAMIISPSSVMSVMEEMKQSIQVTLDDLSLRASDLQEDLAPLVEAINAYADRQQPLDLSFESESHSPDPQIAMVGSVLAQTLGSSEELNPELADRIESHLSAIRAQFDPELQMLRSRYEQRLSELNQEHLEKVYFIYPNSKSLPAEEDAISDDDEYEELKAPSDEYEVLQAPSARPSSRPSSQQHQKQVSAASPAPSPSHSSYSSPSSKSTYSAISSLSPTSGAYSRIHPLQIDARGGWNANDHARYLKLRSEYEQGKSKGVVGISYSHAEFIERVCLELNEGGGRDRKNVTKAEVVAHDSYHDAVLYYKRKIKSLKEDVGRKQAQVMEAMKGALDAAIKDAVMESEVLKERQVLDDRRAEAHAQLDVLRRQKEMVMMEKHKELVEEAERLKKESEMEAAIRREEQADRKKRVAEYHRLREEQERMAAEIVRREEEMKESDDKLKSVYNRKRVEYRSAEQARKAAERQVQLEEMKREHEQREARLERLRELVRVEAEADPERLRRETAAAAAHHNAMNGGMDVDERAQMYSVHGYTVDQLMRDARFKLTVALRDAGLMDKPYARQAIANAKPAKPARVDMFTSEQRESLLKSKGMY